MSNFEGPPQWIALNNFIGRVAERRKVFRKAGRTVSDDAIINTALQTVLGGDREPARTDGHNGPDRGKPMTAQGRASAGGSKAMATTTGRMS